MNSKHYHPQGVPGPHPSGRRGGGTGGPPHTFYQATFSHSGIVTRTQLRTHARNANAIGIDFPVGEGLTTDSHPQPPTLRLSPSRQFGD